MDLSAFESLERSEAAARRFLLSFCWKNHQRFCPRCKHRKSYRLGNGRRRCARCRYTFHDFTGRWLNIGQLTCADWMRVLRLFEQSQTAVEAAAQLDLTYNTVYKALSIIRLSIVANALDARQLLGPGSTLGLSLERRREEAAPASVFGIMEKDGLAFVDLIPGFTAETLLHFKLNFQLKVARLGNIINTDRYQRYDTLVCCVGDAVPLEYFKGLARSVPLDEQPGFWSFARQRLLKFHGVTRQRFPLYLKELEFRYNNRERNLLPPARRVHLPVCARPGVRPHFLPDPPASFIYNIG